MKEKQHSASTSYEAKLSLLMMNTIYRIILHRITNHYSPDELAFLMGRKPTFISEIEQLKHRDLDIQDFYKIARVLGVENAGSLYHDHDPSDEREFTYRITKIINPEGILYQMDRLLENGEPEMLFLLKDENPNLDYYEHSTEREKESLRIAVQALIDLNYFHKERTPREIFAKCKGLLWGYIKPRNLHDVLTAFTKQKAYPRLRHKVSKELGHYYILIKKPRGAAN
ncbi:helix-turn-helix domain-containing protein [Parapedobacter soli]|uniref:helix-turn-helix domain-containing protein n=1 Tax=Parapedobacter soli TaxID=416955 RepID=UPI0021C85289|nr:helix-turn-helix transcriptional regulator [Parapedobacter soli]